MFISKSKKALKPKTSTRRNQQAPIPANLPNDSISISRPAETSVQDGPGEGVSSNLENRESSPVAARPSLRRTGLRNTSRQPSESQSMVERTTSTTNAKPVTTRRGTDGVSIAQSDPRDESEASNAEANNSNATEARSSSRVSEQQQTTLSPPPTQPAAGGYIRKSKKVIQPKARTRRGQPAEKTSEGSTIEPAVGTEPHAGFTEESPARDDVGQRLQAALALHGFQQPPRNSGDASLVASTNSKRTVARAQMDTQSREEDARPRSDTENTVIAHAGAKPTRKRKQPSVNATEDGESNPPTKKAKVVRAKSKSSTKGNPSTTESNMQAPIEITDDAATATKRRSRPRKRKAAATEVDRADQNIATNEVRMGELIVDTGQGQESVREKRLQERDVEMKARKLKAAQEQAREQLQEFMNNPDGSNAATDRPSAATSPSRITTAAVPPGTSTPDVLAAAPRFRIVNGTIVADESSRIIDRRAERARAVEANADATVMEEDDLSRRINSRSFTKYDRPTRWDSASTALFHQGLQYFGLEFSMMACLFPGRSRRQLKAKYIREERADEAFVNALLKDRKPAPSLEELEKLMGKKLKEPRELDEELHQQKLALEEAQRVEDEMHEQRRKEREREAEEQGRRVANGDGSDEESEDGDEEHEPANPTENDDNEDDDDDDDDQSENAQDEPEDEGIDEV